MPALSSGLLRAGIGLKLNQVKLATRSYLRDRTNQATGSLTSYAVAAGLFAAAGIFLIAACFVGAMALFRWIEIHYGMFWAFGAVGALLTAIAAICAGDCLRQTQSPLAEFSVAHQPAARGDQGQSAAAEPDRGRPRHRRSRSAGAFGTAARAATPAATTATIGRCRPA